MPNKPVKKPDTPLAKRGVVTRSFYEVIMLAGFMDDAHFRGFAQDSLFNLTKANQDALLRKAQLARDYASQLSPIDLSGVELRPLEQNLVPPLIKDPTFINMFGDKSFRIMWINPTKLVALQVFVRSQRENIPSNPKDLTNFALPKEWNVPAEIDFTPPFGPIFIVSSSPQLTGLHAELDANQGHVTIKPLTHVNLIQVVKYQDRYFLRNGYHRVAGALKSGVTELPALVVDANQLGEVELPGSLSFFNAELASKVLRPPLVADFWGEAGVIMDMREKRYGASINLQISPFNIGV